MSKKILNLLIMQAKQQFQHLLFFLLKEGNPRPPSSALKQYSRNPHNHPPLPVT